MTDLNKQITNMLMESYEKGVADALDAAEKAVQKVVNAAVEAEREACAQVCESYENDMGYGQPQQCANAIRARGDK